MRTRSKILEAELRRTAKKVKRNFRVMIPLTGPVWGRNLTGPSLKNLMIPRTLAKAETQVEK